MSTIRRIHSLPIGDLEVHAAQLTCWCHPLELAGGVVCHHAKDCREVAERRGLTDLSAGWVNIAEDYEADPPLTEDLAFLVRRLCRVVARLENNNEIREKALDYLKRKGLEGSPLK